MKQDELSKSDKILLIISELSSQNKIGNQITVEDVAVKLWLRYPEEFCMKGYPQYPNVDIQKYITKLLDNNFVTGGVTNYKITSKGLEQSKDILLTKESSKKSLKESSILPRHIKSEINRIINSKTYKYYISTPVSEFVESDFFEFLGTSSRSLTTHDKNIFLSRYNIIVNDVIPFCEKNRSSESTFEKIIELWGQLYNKFKEISQDKVK